MRSRRSPPVTEDYSEDTNDTELVAGVHGGVGVRCVCSGLRTAVIASDRTRNTSHLKRLAWKIT